MDALTSRPGDRREQILAHAQRLFLEKGIDNVTTRDIAVAVGISQPSLYAHFKSRDEIATVLSERAFDRLSDRMGKAAAGAGLAVDRLLRMGEEYVAFGLEESAAYRVAFLLEQGSSSPVEPSTIHASGMRCFGILHDLFREVRQADDAATAARAQSTWASMHGLVALLLSRPEFPWVDRRTLIAFHLESVCRRAFE